jgi:hypothetical protein
VYAEGCDPAKDSGWYERSRELVGGDDFVEYLPLDGLENPGPDATVIIQLTDDGFRAMVSRVEGDN